MNTPISFTDRFSQLFGLDTGSVHPDARLVEDLGLDSIALLEIHLIHEDACGHGCPDLTLDLNTRVRDIEAIALHRNANLRP